MVTAEKQNTPLFIASFIQKRYQYILFITSPLSYRNTTTFYHNNFNKLLLHYVSPLLFKKKWYSYKFFINRLMITLRARRVGVPLLTCMISCTVEIISYTSIICMIQYMIIPIVTSLRCLENIIF
jgi:hypothetical protein